VKKGGGQPWCCILDLTTAKDVLRPPYEGDEKTKQDKEGLKRSGKSKRAHFLFMHVEGKHQLMGGKRGKVMFNILGGSKLVLHQESVTGSRAAATVEHAILSRERKEDPRTTEKVPFPNRQAVKAPEGASFSELAVEERRSRMGKEFIYLSRRIKDTPRVKGGLHDRVEVPLSEKFERDSLREKGRSRIEPKHQDFRGVPPPIDPQGNRDKLRNNQHGDAADWTR